MKLSNTMIAVVVIVAFAGGVLGAQIAGVWQTESSKIPARYSEGDFAGEYNPADIRGSYSFGDIEEAFDVPVMALAQAYGAVDVENPATVLVKSLEESYEGAHETLEIGTDSVRLFVARYLDRPITVADTTGIPDTAIPILRERGTVDDELLARVVALPGDLTLSVGTLSGTNDTSDDGDERTVKGMTTIGELLSWGVTEAEIAELFGGEVGPGNTVLRDFASSQGIEFSSVKTQLQELVDKKQ